MTKKLGRSAVKARKDKDGLLFYQIHVRLSDFDIEILNTELARLEKANPGIRFSRSDAVRSLMERNRKRA